MKRISRAEFAALSGIHPSQAWRALQRFRSVQIEGRGRTKRMTVEATEAHAWIRKMPSKGISPETAAKEIGCSAKHVRKLIERQKPLFATKGPNRRWQLTEGEEYRKWIDAQKVRQHRFLQLRASQLPSMPMMGIGPDLIYSFSEEGLDQVFAAIEGAARVAQVVALDEFRALIRDCARIGRLSHLKCIGSAPWPEIRLPSILWSIDGRKRFIKEISGAMIVAALLDYETFTKMGSIVDSLLLADGSGMGDISKQPGRKILAKGANFDKRQNSNDRTQNQARKRPSQCRGEP